MSILIILIIVAVLSALFNAQSNLQWQKLRAKFKNSKNGLIFDHVYLEAKAFYLYRFRQIPSVTFIEDTDVTLAFAYIDDTLKSSIVDIYQNCFFNRKENTQQFSKTVFVLTNKVMIELAGQYVKILYPNNQYAFVDNLMRAFADYKLPEKKEDFEINIITYSNGRLDLKPLPLTPTNLDLDMYYNDDFKAVDVLIRERLNQQNDKGILLLHGIPGTGKTTYLRHLVGSLKKKVLFLSPSVANNLMNPDFIDLLIENPNAILVIEDAENIMIDRKVNSDSSVSNLLNLSDGLLSDCLNVQIICTFNSHLSIIDSALMRKGRLIAKYEFGKLGFEKARKLSAYFGFSTAINEPMTIAEIANQHQTDVMQSTTKVIGFRRQSELVN